MRGELGLVWPLTWKDIWVPLMSHKEFGTDLATDLFREHVAAPKATKAKAEMSASEFEAFAEAERSYKNTATNAALARKILRRTLFSKPVSEDFAIRFIEKSYSIFEDYDDENFTNYYFNRVDAFLRRYSIRYDLRRPLTLHPTLSGIFASLITDLGQIARQDSHLQTLLREFEDSIRDLRGDLSQGRIKTCIQKQFNLIEAISQSYPGVTSQTLGEICGQIDSWPHATVKEALKKLYGFRSNYPGLGHGGNLNGVLRELDARDMVAIGVMLAGFVPYLTNRMDAQSVYQA